MIMTPLSIILNDVHKGYKLGSSGKMVNHLLFMDDLKLYGCNQDEIDALLGLVQELRTLAWSSVWTSGLC